MATERKATQKAAPATANKAPKAKKPTSAPLSHGVGRRKSAVARVWLRKGSGKVIVNGQNHSTYFDTDLTRLEALKPLLMIPNVAHYDAFANVDGGGLHAQAGATKLGIARALVAFDEALRVPLRAHGFLTVDARVKERKKYGQRAARAKFQFVKR